MSDNVVLRKRQENINVNTAISKRQARNDILKLGLPAFAEQILFTAVTIVSTAIVAHLGPHELLAATWNASLYNLFMSMFIGLALGTTVVIARNCGAGKSHIVPLTMSVSLTIAIVKSIAMLIILNFTLENFFEFFYRGSEAQTLEYATKYGKLLLWSLPFSAGQVVMIASIRGVGNNKMPLVFNSILNVANALLSYMLVNGVIFPRMGLTGAALGVNIARAFGFTASACYVFLINKDLRPTFKKPHLWSTPISKRILHIGIPSVVEATVSNGGFVILSMVLVSLGTVAQCGYNIGANANSIIGAPASGLGIAMTVLVSKAIGARKYDYAELLVSQAYKIVLIMASILGLCMVVFAKQIVLIYTSNPEMLEAGIYSVYAFSFISLLVGVSFMQAGILKGAGAAKYVAFTMFIGLWVCRIFLSWTFINIFELGLLGVFIGITLDYGSRASLYYFKVRSGDWKFIKI